MFKYIEGQMVEKSEHMLSAKELAELYHLQTLNGNPNGLLIRSILDDKLSELDISFPEYYYPHGHGVMRVYPQILYKKVLTDFVLPIPFGYEGTYETRKGTRIKYRRI